MSTDSPSDGANPRTHRAGSSVSTLQLVALAVITAIVLVLVAVGVVGWLRPHNDHPATASTPIGSVSHSPSSSPNPSPSLSPSVSVSRSSSKPTPTQTKSSTKPTQSSAKPTETPSKSTPTPTPTHSSSSAKPPPNVPRDYPVVVLNETPITGLAARVAKQLRHDGWTVTGVANWIGEIHETTVYYPAGTYTRAQRLAADLGVDRIRPRVGGMLTNRLTVVLHDPPN